MIRRSERLSQKLAAAALSLLICSQIAQAQTAPPTNHLQLWLKADAGVSTNAGGLVGQWNDQSGHGNNALQADDNLKPKWVPNAVTNRPAVRFDGADDFMDVTSAPGLDIVGDIASFAVIRVDDYANYNSIWGKTAGPNGNLPAPNDFYLIQGSGIPQLYRGDGASSFANVQAERPVRQNSYVVLGFRQVGTAVTHYLNGSTNGVGELTVTPADAGTNLKIGSREDLFTKLKGDMAELLIYDDGLSDSETTTAIEYLKKKYGILNAPPTVSITSPTNNATLSAPASLTVKVNAADEDGRVTRVDLLANGSIIGTATAAPFSFPLTVNAGGTVTLTAVARDDKDASTASSNVVVTVTASGPAPSLPTNAHLKLWLRGDAAISTGPGGGVVVWADQSGNSNNAAQADETFAPTVSTLSGKPAIHFDGEDDFMDVADSESISITGDIATFFVGRFEDFRGFRAIWGKTSGNQPRPTDYYVGANSGIPNVVRGYTTNDTQNVNQGVGAAGAVTANVPLVLGFQQASSNLTHYLNGSAFGSGKITLTPQDADTPLKIGSRDDFATKMKGDMAELLIYDASLSSNELAAVSQYLATKYNIPIIQAANVAPTVSLSSPSGGTNVTAPGNVTVTATATDPDGSVVRVDFFANGSPIGSDASSPYSATFKVNNAGSIAVTAVAVDNLGRRTTSGTVNLTATGGETAPIPTDGLALWLRPDRGVTTGAGGAVTLWEDWSGNFNNAVQTDVSKAPTLTANVLNGQPVLHFDGADDFLEVGNSPSVAITGDMTTFFVVNVDDYATYRAIWAKTAGGGGNLPAANDYYLLPNSGIPRFYHGDPAGAIAPFDGTDPVPAGEFVIAGYGLAGTTATHYLGTAENGSGELTAPGGDPGGTLRIGTRGDSFTKFKGSFAELVIYARALTEAERTQITTYLQNKYFTQPTTGPKLTVNRSANTLTISWPDTATGFDLESSLTLGAGAVWTKVTEPVVPANGQNTVTVPTTGATRYFRLRKP